MKKYFWQNWKKKSELEKKAIKIILSSKKIILENFSKEGLVSIYVKGSFVRREMNNKSDIDIMIIVEENKDMKKVDKLYKKYLDKFEIPLQLSGYSLKELKKGKLSKIKTTGIHRPLPIKLFALLSEHKLIYGKPLDKKKLKRRVIKEDLKGMIESFEEFIFPSYKKKIIDFDFLVKQVLWLVYDEIRFSGKKIKCVWKDFERVILNKEHIFYDAIKFRSKKGNEKEKRNFIIKLKKYLGKLVKKIK